MSNYTWDFLTLLPECNNIDIYKDVGMIPYTLAKEHGLHTAVASSNTDENAGDQLDMANTRMDIIHLKQKNRFLAGVFFLLGNAGRIRVLNLYHGGKVVYAWSKLYKMLNPKGKIYLKLDMDFRYCDKLDTDEGYRRVFQRCTEIVDNTSVESSAIRERIEKYSKKEIMIIPNGYYDNKKYPVNISKKDDIFLTVGRLGTEQKATEILLEGFAKSAQEHNWKMILVGGIEEQFKNKIEEYYDQYPDLKTRVIFTGIINDKRKLYEYYDTAKVFVLPSRWEGFPIALSEALSRGCRVLLSNEVPPYKDIAADGKAGYYVKADNAEELSQTLVKMAQQSYDNKNYEEIITYSFDNYSWVKICEELKKKTYIL